MKNSEKFGHQERTAPVVSTYQVPTEIVELPSRGNFYPEGHPLSGAKTVEIKFMTTREEDLLISPSLVEKGIAIDRVIESLVVSSRLDASTLIPGDKNAILMAARKSAYGNDYVFNTICTSCGSINEVKASMEDVKIKEIIEDENCKFSENGNILMILPKSGATIELRIIGSEDERIIEETVKKRLKNNLPAEELITRYRRMFVSVNGSEDQGYINNFIINTLGIADSRYLKKKYLDMVPDVSFQYSHNCKSCNNILEGGVPIGADFFWPKV